MPALSEGHHTQTTSQRGLNLNSQTLLMRWRLAPILVMTLITLVLASCLFATFCLSVGAPPFIYSVSREIQAACRDTETQWMVVICLVSYFVTFLVLERRLSLKGPQKTNSKHSTAQPVRERSRSYGAEGFVCSMLFWSRNPDVWLCLFVVLVLWRYASDYATAAWSLQVVVLLTGIVMGKSIAFFIKGLEYPVSNVSVLTAPETDARKCLAITPSFSFSHKAQMFLAILVFPLAISALWQPERGMEFFYRGQRRWTGPWDNPNLFGLLMGVGLTLAVGQLVSGFRFQVSSHPGCETETFILKPLTSCAAYWLKLVVYFCAAVLCGIGLFKSYSRGAWLGTALALSLLLFQIVKFQVSSGIANRAVAILRQNWFPCFILLISIFVICFWQFRHTESPVLRRVFSAGNPNDFSWRNRVVAWQGAGRMIRDKPLVGFGWGKAEGVYSKEYRVARLEETAAIQMNDYLMLGISAGGPALTCLLAYIGLVVKRVTHNGQVDRECSTLYFSPVTPTLAGAGVLLVGFWFDGGLFKLAPGVMFWVLLELARVSSFPTSQLFSSQLMEREASEKKQRKSLSLAQIVLRFLASIVALGAVALSSLHLIVPQLPVTDRTLAIARKLIVPPPEQSDFEFLAVKPIWSGQSLKVLLQHSHLANYNRSLINWKVDDEIYREFVLSPEIDSAWDGDLKWRRQLWEFFYPRIRKEISVEAAAEIVLRHLRDHIKFTETTTAATAMAEIWEQKNANGRGLAAIRVATLRSVGIPARLALSGEPEFWDGSGWRFGM